ncbi:MAG: hypothetical protein JWM57_3233, partial [Phycisphaerales bacterium]|nr:hypothetical protein [Phycisphaerales bacterium]
MAEFGLPTPLEYAAPAKRPASRRTATFVSRISFVPSVVGGTILGLYACSGLEILVTAGGYWLFLGGIMAAAVGISAVVMFFVVFHDKWARAR